MADDVQIVNGIAMPPLYNKRAGQMWDIISAHVDFSGKRVIDLGCGHGDLVFRAAAAGARWVQGFDIDADCIDDCEQRARPLYEKLHVGFHNKDFTEIEWAPCDIIICCSVLPYLRNPGDFINKMAYSTPVSIIECQYNGDGPGLLHIDNDGEMEWWLMQQSIGTSNGWSTVTAIGKTYVEGRDKWRTIWMCER